MYTILQAVSILINIYAGTTQTWEKYLQNYNKFRTNTTLLTTYRDQNLSQELERSLGMEMLRWRENVEVSSPAILLQLIIVLQNCWLDEILMRERNESYCRECWFHKFINYGHIIVLQNVDILNASEVHHFVAIVEFTRSIKWSHWNGCGWVGTQKFIKFCNPIISNNKYPIWMQCQIYQKFIIFATNCWKDDSLGMIYLFVSKCWNWWYIKWSISLVSSNCQTDDIW